MLRDVPSDIKQIIQTLLVRGLKVSLTEQLGTTNTYSVNGHTLSEDELRMLAQKRLLTSWHVLNYARLRAARKTNAYNQMKNKT